MADVTAFNRKPTTNAAEKQLRVDLAAAFRLAAHYDWHEAVANHFSLAVSPDGKQFLKVCVLTPVQPRGPSQVGAPGRPAIDAEQQGQQVMGLL